MMRVLTASALALALLVPMTGAVASTAATAPSAATVTAKAKVFKNCTALNKKYPHGVGRSKKVRDHTTGTPVTNFKVSKALYKANKSKDRDGDGIACEKR